MNQYTHLPLPALFESSYRIEWKCYDMEEVNRIPLTATWTLTNKYGTVINTAVVSPGDLELTNYTTLSGSDLTMFGQGKERRIFTVSGTYLQDGVSTIYNIPCTFSVIRK